MKFKIKKYIKRFIDYILTDECKSIVMILLVGITILSICWGIMMAVIADDLTDVVTEKNKKIIELESSVDYFGGQAAKYKMISEEYYDLYNTCQESASWYEKFYYDNVDKHTGEIEAEYYE